MADEPRVSARAPVRRGRRIFQAPAPSIVLLLTLAVAAALAGLLFGTSPVPFLEGWLLAFVLPSGLAAALTPPLVAALGGRLELHRSVFLSFVALLLVLPIAAVWRLAILTLPAQTPGVLFLAAFLVGPIVWFRHMSLYGVARAHHGLMLPATLLQPVLYLLGTFVLLPFALPWILAALACGAIGFGCAVALLRAADRPLRREFQASGVRLIRPLLDHVSRRDPAATAALEEFFDRFAGPSDLSISLLRFERGARSPVTVALPAVHPGPFGALGASDLPRKLETALGPGGGVVLCPHTPSDHDLDLPTEREVRRVGDAGRSLLDRLGSVLPSRASRLVTPGPGSLARAQLLGDVVVVSVSQAPAPTDDIAFSVGDRLHRDLEALGVRVALIDAHNSYVEDQGDITYGTPVAEKLMHDARAAVEAAVASARDGPLEVGTAVRSGYLIGRDGIGPSGIRALVLRSGAGTTAYVLIDGNNLVLGCRAPIVRALEMMVDVAEVWTTDNHVVHEVDGGINPVGERMTTDALVREASEAVRTALADLAPAEVRFGRAEIPGVRVLVPGFTARLLTSLGDTLSMFENMLAATLLLVLTGSLVVVFALA